MRKFRLELEWDANGASFIGLTPGVIVCIAVWRWLGGFFDNRKGLKLGQRQGQVLRVLR